uniref:Uncharacterized protein n=1 Tax=Acrobeloides nanus TaxID=290746 RepID=A0A914DR85_9BILA
MFSCSWINPDGWTSILVYYANGTGPIQYNSLPGEIILNAVFNCTFVNGLLQWTISDFGPDPISNQVICEATPYPSTTGLETTTASVTCPPGGTWSAWNSGTCNDTCGMWGTLAQTRTCLSAANGCPCTGASSQPSSYCGPLVCKFPRSMCRAGYTRTALNAQIICV